MSDTAQTSPDKLPLPFGVLIAERNSAALPLPLKRRLGEAESSGETAPDTDIDYGYNPWRDPMRPAVSSSFGFVLHPVAVRSAARGGFSDGLSVGRGWNDIYMETVDAAACMRAATQGMESLRREQESVYTPSVLYSGKAAANISGMADLRRETRANMSGGASLARSGRRKSGAAGGFKAMRPP